jgi:hypothetical protein
MGRSCSGTRAVKFRQHHPPDVRHVVGREDHGPFESAPGTWLVPLTAHKSPSQPGHSRHKKGNFDPFWPSAVPTGCARHTADHRF